MDFKGISAKVKAILRNDEYARSSDLYLWSSVIENSKVETLTSYEKDTLTYLLRKGEKSLPNFASVMRSRQKDQAENPELYAPRVRKSRAKLEKEFKDFFGLLNE